MAALLQGQNWQGKIGCRAHAYWNTAATLGCHALALACCKNSSLNRKIKRYICHTDWWQTATVYVWKGREGDDCEERVHEKR